MASKRINVLVYSGNGSTIESVRHCVYSLRRLLSPYYAVIPVSGDAIIKEPWSTSCALLVMPGGADLGYCRTLNGEGNRKIAQFVERGGSYFGFCAGGYYASKRCEFEIGNPKLEVIGDRELAFYPGTCRGLAFPGFVYHSEKGARDAELNVDKSILAEGSVPEIFRSYYNGGGVFVDAPKFREQGVEVLASYTERIHVYPGEGTAAVVYCKVGEGAAILTGPHPEFAAVNLDLEADAPGFREVVDSLTQDDKPRTDFMKACLTKMGLKVNQEQNTVPSLSRLHLTSTQPPDTVKIIDALRDIITTENGEDYIRDENDTFHLENPSAWSLGSLSEALPKESNEKTDHDDGAEDRILDYSTVIKRLIVHDKQHPASKETPYFNHDAYFSNLKHYQSTARDVDPDFGRNLLYGEVVTSTNTMLEKNTQLLRRIPSGFTATATVQVAGRGRGTNVWVSPAGSLMFSLVVRHDMSLTPKAPVVFLQYLAALAIVDGINSYDKGYQGFPVKLKWPNDIYARDPSQAPSSKAYVKIGGILVNSHYSASEYLSVIGIGLNTTNALPTTSLAALTPAHLPAISIEKLLARLITSFSSLYSRFRIAGFDRTFEEMYYKHWLHTDQIVTLEAEGGIKARIKGITRDWGLLVAEELGWEDRPTGKMIQLQSDSNSFDFFKGLLKRKV
ncbi:biotin holocarboxylase synthetase [Lambiella insularis]|nr:biotin holocarboxylase synthetase [Lambiella insularis]